MLLGTTAFFEEYLNNYLTVHGPRIENKRLRNRLQLFQILFKSNSIWHLSNNVTAFNSITEYDFITINTLC